VKETNSEPGGFYQLWLKSLQDGQEQMMKAGAQGILDSKQAWEQWLDATMTTWSKTSEMGPDPLGLTAQWIKMMEGVQEKLLNGGNVGADPFTFFKEWYDAISESWSRVVEETIASEQFLEFNKLFLESYTSFSKAFRRANEEYLRILQLPSRADISHVAELVVALEDKVDQQEDRFDDIENAFSQTAKSEAVASLEEHLVKVESTLNESIAGVRKHLDTVQAKLSETLNGLEGRLDAVQAKLDETSGLGRRLDTVESKLDDLHSNLARFQAIEGLVQRLEQVESKQDRILAEMAKIETHRVNGHGEPQAEVPQKPQKKKASQSVVNSEKSDSEA
jgi:polyhydroxyalkanoic acid synthase PhaR subunit